MNHQKMRFGTRWTFEHRRSGLLIARRVVENVCPDDWITYMLGAGMGGAAQITEWYLLLFSDNYTPLATDTYDSPGFTESTDYSEDIRVPWAHMGASNKSISNSASKASFTMLGNDTTIYGGALVSCPVKGDTEQAGAILGPAARSDTAPLTDIVETDIIDVFVELTGADDI
jgi:hypothetical protein